MGNLYHPLKDSYNPIRCSQNTLMDNQRPWIHLSPLMERELTAIERYDDLKDLDKNPGKPLKFPGPSKTN